VRISFAKDFAIAEWRGVCAGVARVGGAPRLRRIGLDVPDTDYFPEDRLYESSRRFMAMTHSKQRADPSPGQLRARRRMREPVNSTLVRRFMRDLAVRSNASGRVYLTGGASAVLLEWCDTTVDIDIKIQPEDDRVLRAIPELKEKLLINIELASPADFIPPLPSWEERSPFIQREVCCRSI
jgi:hypothetical protein